MESDRSGVLISLLEQTNNFLADKLQAEPIYSELIETLELLAKRLEPNSKPTVKIVSPSHVLATKLQRQNEANDSLRSLYKFEVVSPISQIRLIIHNCDLIYLLYNSTHKILTHHQKLIELAQTAKIPVLLLVHRSKSQSDSYKDWLTAQDYSFDGMELAVDDFINLDDRQQVELCQRSLFNFLPAVRDSYPTRIRKAAKQEIELFFRQKLAHKWQEINKIKSQYWQDKQLHIYQQQFRQSINNNNQFRQQVIRDIKQAINHAKADLLNPFLCDSFIFEIQQIIDSARVKTIKKPEHIYLYLVLEDMPNAPLFHDYVWDLCQQKAAEIIDREWSKIVRVYGSGGLQSLVDRTNRDLSDISPLLETELTPTILLKPTLNLATIIDDRALEFNSRIIFDYSYLQSSWFRLLISVSIGFVIYLFTLFFFGEGRYFGFLIIIFQIINLITGQNIKKAKLKQHTKELKRIVDQRYQSLVRIIINQITQTLILSIDSQAQQDREQWSEAIAAAQEKLDELKQTSDRHKSRIDSLKQTRSTIQSWFN